MTGKEIITAAFKRQPTIRAPWVPFVGCHGGKLIGVSAYDYLQSGELIAKGLKRAVELYQPDGLPIMFDLQIEAEVLGCDLHWAEDVPPSVSSHPLSSDGGKSIVDLPEFSTEKGRFREIAKTLRIIKNDIGDDIALYGLICGPFTLALHLLGNEIFLQMYDDPNAIKSLLDFCSDIAKKTSDFYLNNGVDIIAVVDPMTSQISPEHFREFVTPTINPIFDHIRQCNALSSIFVCGDVDRNLECMCETHCDNISVDEQISIPKLKGLAEKYNKSFGGNLKLTVALLLGDEDDCRIEAIRNIDEGGTTGFILAPGCDIPYNVPEENIQAVSEMVHDDYKREIAKKTLAAKEFNFDYIQLPDYDNSAEIILDIITLDSSSCAPCQYMLEAAQKAVADLSIKTVIREHKIKNQDGIGMMCKLGVSSLPTICIDGKITFISIIPDKPTLQAAIHNRARQKDKLLQTVAG